MTNTRTQSNLRHLKSRNKREGWYCGKLSRFIGGGHCRYKKKFILHFTANLFVTWKRLERLSHE